MIAIAASYFLMKEWLQNFAYRINLIEQWWVFLLIFTLLLIFVMIIVSLKSFFAARVNPVENLRYE